MSMLLGAVIVLAVHGSDELCNIYKSASNTVYNSTAHAPRLWDNSKPAQKMCPSKLGSGSDFMPA